MKPVAFALILAGLAVAGLWVAHGADLATCEKVAVTTVTTDDFGDEVETVEWKKPTDYPVTGFHIGFDYAAPAIAGLIGIGIGLLFLERRRKNT